MFFGSKHSCTSARDVASSAFISLH